MIGTKLFSIIGVRVRRKIYHTSCAPTGTASPIFEPDEGVETLTCAKCDQPLVDLTAEPELEEYEANACLSCGAPLSEAGAMYCDIWCEAAATINGPF
ncbi:hypothetical protein [Ktedonobacter robiniae]|uniref:Phosphohydrolase n=1 Tax=Ktedonobacter robiniae TaxID=2778365 RepID=A0ABQ3US19_9CHLR|nr:hypothetical protein [Ktedonobacter robiniae]GHO55500.1 hypothetical protein KSB_39750 [Ktedonobacter robiniae]